MTFHSAPPMTNETIRFYPHDYLMKWLILPLIPLWVRPNHITIFRFLATPFVLALLLYENYQLGVPAFIIVAFSDALDGSLARVRKQITAWGTFYDPVADKILIGSVLILIVLRHINIWFGLAIIFIELLIMFGGLYRKYYKGFTPSANVYGKLKMLMQVLGVSFLLLALWSGYDLFVPVSIGTFSVAMVFALISLITYGL